MVDLYLLCEDLKKPQSQLNKATSLIIKDIYTFLNRPSEKTKTLIEGWMDDFEYIYGGIESNLSSNSKLVPGNLLMHYGIKDDVKEEEHVKALQLLFFSNQTFFSLLIKMIMREVLEIHGLENQWKEIVLGEFAKHAGIVNYCEFDWYCWPLYEIENGFDNVLRKIEALISNYRVIIGIAEFAESNNYDYIKQIYESVIPKEFRHALGEYYTPDWLAEYTLKTITNSTDKSIDEIRFLDPTCGSGTFLMKAIAAKKRSGLSCEKITESVIGFDINPLAVLTAKTNYIMSIIDLIGSSDNVSIPVYCLDVLQFAKSQMNATNSINALKGSFSEDSDEIKYSCVKNIGQVDAIIGNPPWVNWEYMPQKYRFGNQQLWIDYNLFSAKGRDLSFSKEDISVLITYIVMDVFLKDGGVIGFVIRQGVFKSAQNGVGFRKFSIRNEIPIRVIKVDDMSKIKAFDNATNSTAVFFAEKGKKNIYPVSYYLWEKRQDVKRCVFNAYSELRLVTSQMSIKKQCAMPAVLSDPTSIWINTDEENLKRISKVLGNNDYRARTGAFTGGANAVYWLDIIDQVTDSVIVRNQTDRAKRKAKQVEQDVEKAFVFPMLKGSNVKMWNVSYNTYLLCPHTKETKMWPVPFEDLKQNYPKTADYLVQFKEDLDGRNGFAGWEKEIQKKEFHAILRIGEYTFSKYKVIWKYIASEFVCAVISDVEDKFLGKKALLPNEKIMYVSTNDEMEAYYLCGVLSSTIIGDCVKGYMNPTSISAHVLNKLNIPLFDKDNCIHMEIAKICREGHGQSDITKYIQRIDELMSDLYGNP